MIRNMLLFLMLFALSCGEDRPAPNTPAPNLPYTVEESADGVTCTFPDYHIALQYGEPFGIVSLRLKGQPWDFVHPQLPAGDWEWFWFQEEGRTDTAKVKLLQPRWDAPQIETSPEEVVLRFRRAEVLRPGITLRVEYHLRAAEPALVAEYSIDNGSSLTLKNPYVMVGFPGFTDHAWINTVANPRSLRQPLPPYTNFLDEAKAKGLAEYPLLRDDTALAEGRQLKGMVGISVLGTTYLLEATHLPTPGLRQIFSAHVNKPGYLTSHLYVSMADLAPGASRSLAVQYELIRL
ncbi:MAG: hypothetical protein IT369_04325 [Candidatus Latescibacteria bacterium]|nr:hypothetical protein [Candidatus Latescibacterota bacterium]